MRELGRRELLAALGIGSRALATRTSAQDAAKPAAAPTPAPSPGTSWKLSLGAWSFHRAIRSGELAHEDLAKRARSLGFAGLDHVSTFLADQVAKEGHLAELAKRARDEGIANVCILVDGEGDLADRDRVTRKAAVEAHLKWLDAAAALGCESIRVNLAGSGTPEERGEAAVESLRELSLWVRPPVLRVLVENHGGLSSDASWLSAVMRRGHRSPEFGKVGTLPDFGNWTIGEGRTYDRYRGVSELMPWAGHVSAKSHEFDAQGNETSTDYRRMLRILRDARYERWIEVEYEGDRLSEEEGVRATKRLVETVMAELAATK